MLSHDKSRNRLHRCSIYICCEELKEVIPSQTLRGELVHKTGARKTMSTASEGFISQLSVSIPGVTPSITE